jgi:hypothetical protein
MSFGGAVTFSEPASGKTLTKVRPAELPDDEEGPFDKLWINLKQKPNQGTKAG